MLLEDKLLTQALQKEGLTVSRINWDHPNFDFSQTKVVIFRAIWDYFDRYPEFSKWLAKVQKQTILINPAETIQWNIDKHYLADLATHTIPIVPTVFIEKGRSEPLHYWYHQVHSAKAVLKPAIAGGARHTYVLNSKNLDEHEAIFKKLLQEEAWLIQPFIESVLSRGEVSHMVFGGVYSHSVLKKAKPGDFRVQDDFGGSLHTYTANAEEIAFVEKVLAACQPQPSYARVDVLWDAENKLALAELEVIEPELWFRRHSQAAPLLAKAIKAKYFNG